ncbi:sulfotransferase, partial [Escherichia coli]|nr:sulfotransferase [Escherichia coli]
MEHHIILTLGRSGSNTLRDMMNQNPEILNFGEVLGDWNTIRKLQKRLPLMPRGHEAYLDWIMYSPRFRAMANTVRSARKMLGREAGAAKRLAEVKTFGVKDFSLNFRRCGLLGYLDARPDIKVIGLQRDNVVDRMISNAMLGATGVIEVRRDSGAGKRTLRLDPARVSQLLT